MSLEKVDVVVDVGKLFTGDFVGHEVGEDFFGPYIVKPAHGDEVAKPQMGSLVGNQFQTGCLLLLRGVFLQEDATVVHLDGSRMFHAAKLIAR